MEFSVVKDFFPFVANALDFEALPITSGHINSTYALTLKGQTEKYIIQKINTNVFKDPEGLMNNIRLVTEHISSKGLKTLCFIENKDGKLFSEINGEAWRVCKFLENSEDLSKLKINQEVYEKAGKALGDFQKSLMDFDATTLCEVIPNFHNTKSRYNDFEKAVSENKSGRKETCTDEIEFVRKNKDLAALIQNKIENGTLALSVTHNDTKFSNIMVDRDTKQVICFIDLDTIMPGSVLFDFGDALRMAGSTAAEDEADLSKVNFSMENYESFRRGYLGSYGEFLSDVEKSLLLDSVAVMTYENGMRFLADYINGDTYFHTDYPEHNLVRARNQFKLVKELKDKS